MDCIKGLFTLSLICLLEGQQEVMLGTNVLLQCHSLRGEHIQVLKWIRPDLQSEGYVFFYRTKRSYGNYQHSLFAGRVQLVDPEMKEGNASIVLGNVSLNDSGRYECHVSVRSAGHRKTTVPEMLHSIILNVTVSAHAEESERENSTRENTDVCRQHMNEPYVAAGVISVVALVVVAAAVTLWKVHNQVFTSKSSHNTMDVEVI